MVLNFICFALGALSGMVITCLAVIAGKDNK